MSYRPYFSVGLLRLFIGAFLIVLGIGGIFPEIGESIFSLKFQYYWLEVVFGIVEIICGLLILLGFILFSDSKGVQWGSLIAFIFWVARIIFSRFIWGMNFVYNSQIVFPKFFEWLLVLLCDLIIANAILILIRRYD